MTAGETFDRWAILEKLGHVRLAGRVTEEMRFGAPMGRIDIPQADGTFVTQYFSGGSVYSLTPVGEAEARAVAAACQVRPVQAWEMPRLPAPETETVPADYAEPGGDVFDALDDEGEDDIAARRLAAHMESLKGELDALSGEGGPTGQQPV